MPHVGPGQSPILLHFPAFYTYLLVSFTIHLLLFLLASAIFSIPFPFWVAAEQKGGQGSV